MWELEVPRVVPPGRVAVPGASAHSLSAAGRLMLEQSRSGSPKRFKLLPLLIVLEIDLLDLHLSSFNRIHAF